jgi:hypothetical protein
MHSGKDFIFETMVIENNIIKDHLTFTLQKWLEQ